MVGATGAVGLELIKILEERKFPVGSLKLFASENSLGKKLVFKGKEIPVETLEPGCFEKIQIVFFFCWFGDQQKICPVGGGARGHRH